MFLSFQNNAKFDDREYMINMNYVKEISIGVIKDTDSKKWFGKKIIIETFDRINYTILGYSDTKLHNIYKDIKEKINEGFNGIYDIFPVNDELLFEFTVYPGCYDNPKKIELIGNKDDISYLKNRFKLLNCDDIESDFIPSVPGPSGCHYAIYYYDPDTSKYIRVSKSYGYKNEKLLENLFKAIDDGDSFYQF